MSLCLQCGKIGDHARGCANAAPDAFDTAPAARNARALATVQELQAKVKEVKPLAASSPREAAKAIFALEQLMERSPSSDLSSFEHKRHYQAAEKEVKAAKAEATAALGDKGEGLFADLAFAKKALELLHAAQSRRREVAALDLVELTKLAEIGFDPKENVDPTDPGTLVRAACEAIEKRLAATAAVDDEVDAWGKAYLEPLAAGEAPREFPSNVTGATTVPLGVLGGGLVVAAAGGAVAVLAHQVPIGGGIAGLGALVAVVGLVLFSKAAAAKKAAPASFAALSQRFRDRLYLVCVLRALRGILTGLSKAEEGLRTATGGTENAARWKRIKTQERDLVKALCGDWDEKHSVDDEMLRRIASAGPVQVESIRSARELVKDEWDGLAKAYQAERREDAESSDEMRLAVLADVVLAHASQKPEAQAQQKRAISEARNAFAGRATSRLSSKDL
jgi:hypothetical protein